MPFQKIVSLIIVLFVSIPLSGEIKIKKDYHKMPFTQSDLNIILDLSREITDKKVETIFIGSISHPLKYPMCVIRYKPERDEAREKMAYPSVRLCRKEWCSFPKFRMDCTGLFEKEGWATCASQFKTFEKDIFAFEWGELILSVRNPSKLDKLRIREFLDLIKKKKYIKPDKTVVDENGNEWVESTFTPEIDLKKIDTIDVKKDTASYQITLYEKTGDWSGTNYVIRFFPEENRVVFENHISWIS